MNSQPSLEDIQVAIADIEGPESDMKRQPIRWRNFKVTLFATAVVIADGWIFGDFILAGCFAIGLTFVLFLFGSPRDRDIWDWQEGAVLGIGYGAFFNAVGLLIWSIPKTLNFVAGMVH